MIMVFKECISNYHIYDDVDGEYKNPFEPNQFENLLYKKSWIDTVQWHLEDIIREPSIDPRTALTIKRRIDKSNQIRTDIVELIDDYYLDMFSNTKINEKATINTESPAWAIDRLSILELKIFHMQQEILRKDVNDDHIVKCQGKLDILLNQEMDLSLAIEILLSELKAGKKYMKVYRQMKMYNDPNLNPVLYEKKS